MWLTILKYAAGPVIGAIIGYFTNLLAVKMLFYPRKPILIFGHKLPFTPGVIPKGKPRLARAIGKAVGETLITKEDLESKLLSENVINGLTDKIAEELSSSIKENVIKITALPENMYEDGKQKVSESITNMIISELNKVDLSSLIVDKGSPLIRDSIQNPMIKMFLTEDLIKSLANPIGEKLKILLATEGKSYIQSIVFNKLSDGEEKSAVELLEKVNVSEMMLKGIVSSIIRKVVSGGVGQVLESVDIAGMVESKINDMDIDELEKLILQVMKKELNTIVNLGALIGLVLGLVNMLIQKF